MFLRVAIFLAFFCYATPALAQLQAPNRQDVVQAVIDAHPEIDSCDEESLDKGRALLVDWAAQRLNKMEEFKRWGRKSRGKPVDDRAVNPNTDALTFFRTDGKFEIYDVVVGGAPGQKGGCGASWGAHGPIVQGENGWWAPPQLRAEDGSTSGGGTSSGGTGGGNSGGGPAPTDLKPIVDALARLEASQTAQTEQIGLVLAAIAALEPQQLPPDLGTKIDALTKAVKQERIVEFVLFGQRVRAVIKEAK